MSRIEDLIAKYCPNGVKYEPVNTVFHSLPKGTLKQNQLESDGQYPVINSGRDFYGFYSQFNNDCEAIVIASRGEHAGFVSYMSGKFWAGGLCYPYAVCDTNILLPKYAFYYLKSKEQHIMDTLVSRGSIPALNKADIDKFNIPVPPLAVQEEIVNILDSFTLLEAELEAELVARKKQYEHYRDELLNIADKPNVQVMALYEVADFYYGKGNTIPKNGGEYPVYGCNGIVAYTDTYNNEDGPIIGHIGSAGIVNWGKGKHFVTYNGTICSVHKDIMLSKYAYYLLKSLHLENYVKGAQPFLSASDFRDTKIPVPTLAEQERIVSILDKFDALVNDISDGLPAEINAHRQQYEYYRDKLLNFEPMAA